MEQRYEPAVVEPRWQARWERDRLFAAGARAGRPKHYVLEMFPYPSGALHMGHVRNYLIGDVLARYARMRGFDVMHPMGWDALGLPAENAAIKDGRHPAERTRENVESFRAEMQRLGFSYDWSREFATSDPEYYRWNQWFFVKLHERGLVYRRRSQVNYCPSCATVLANEQVKDGRCERCGHDVTLRRIPEWAFRITRYAERLLANLATLPRWNATVVRKQEFWIGKSEGVELDFRVPSANVTLSVFTTRADTVFGCTCLVIAPEHPAIAAIAAPDKLPEVRAFAEAHARKPAARGFVVLAKEAVDTGAVAVHPLTGATIPILAGNYVVADYGTGCVMCVPGHDTRDHELAVAHGVPVVAVVRPQAGEPAIPYCDDGILVDSGAFTGMTSGDARVAIARAAEAGGFGRPVVTYRQRDWGFSRQRYWGTPIPIVYCDACDPAHDGIPVPLDQLPVRLPDIEVDKVLTGRGEPPLAKVPAFVATACPRCGGPARREVETMDTFVDSAWYFARFLDPHNASAPFARAAADHWLPIDTYIGGPEHSTMHLLYFRFWTMVMRELGLVAIDEPVVEMITQGIVNGPDGRKMSKRWGNVVAPAAIVERYGADVARTYVMFAGPHEAPINWSDEAIEGAAHFLDRAWRLAYERSAPPAAERPGDRTLAIRRAAHKTLRRVTEDLERKSFNTAIARLMELVNALTAIVPDNAAEHAAMAEAIRIMAVCLSPFAPHIADEISEHYGAAQSLQAEAWPAWDPVLAYDEIVTYAIRIDGKVRGEVRMAASEDAETVRAAAEADASVQPWLAGKRVTDFRFVPGRMVVFKTTD